MSNYWQRFTALLSGNNTSEKAQRKRNAAIEEAYRTLQKDHGLAVVHVGNLEQENARLQEDLKGTRATIKARDLEMSALHGEKVEVQAQLDITRNAVKTLEMKNAALQTEIDRLKHRKLSAQPKKAASQ